MDLIGREHLVYIFYSSSIKIGTVNFYYTMLKLFFSFLFVGLLIYFLGQFDWCWYLFLLVVSFIEGAFIKMFFNAITKPKPEKKGSIGVILFMGLIFFLIYRIIGKDYTTIGFQISYLVSLYLGFTLYSENNKDEIEEQDPNLNT